MSDASTFLAAMRLAVVQAGAVALHLRGEVANRGKAEGNSPESNALTAADLATQDVILHQLHHAMPHVAVDAEEDTEAVGLFAPADGTRPIAVLDPIDGTLNYAEGSDDFAVMAALIERGRFTAAIVHFPVYAVTFWAQRGGGTFEQHKGGEPVRVVTLRAPARVLTTPRAPQAWTAPLEGAGYAVEPSRCSAVDATAPLLHRAVAACGDGKPDRRRATGFLLTTEAGGQVLWDGVPWAGEDPDVVARAVSLNVVADAATSARRITQLLARDLSEIASPDLG